MIKIGQLQLELTDLILSKKSFGLFRQFLQSAARIIYLPEADKFHTSSLRCILRQVHALVQNVSEFIFCFRRKLCEAFFAVCNRSAPAGADRFIFQLYYKNVPEFSLRHNIDGSDM